MYVEWPVEITRSGVDDKGKYITITETVFRPRDIDMLNARYGRVKTDDKVINDVKRKTYKQLNLTHVRLSDAARDYERRTQLHVDPEYQHVMTPANMWTDFVPVFDAGVTDREEYLYDVIDTATGYVIVRTFKHSAKKFIEDFVKQGFYFCGEEEADIEIRRGNNRRTEKKIVGVYASGMKTIRSYRKLTVKG